MPIHNRTYNYSFISSYPSVDTQTFVQYRTYVNSVEITATTQALH
jgi:hypothetical protein